MTSNTRRRDCASTHFGPWMVREEWMAEALASVKSGQWKPEPQGAMCGDDEEPQRYHVVNGVAVISIAGHITKNPSSFGGTSTIRTREALRMAAKDRGVKSILLVIDSPGGSVYGVSDVAADIRTIDRDEEDGKPVYAYCDSGLCCSAAYWIASQCRRIYCNPTALIGNIGVYGVLVDTSEADEMMGLRYVLISTGGVKGLGADGKVTEALIADYQREINEFGSLFFADVKAGRRLSDEQLAAVTDGRAHVGAQALPYGLADEIASIDSAMQAIIQENTMNRDDFLKAAGEHADWLAEAAKPLTEAARNEATEALQSVVDETKAKATEDLTAAKTAAFDDGVNTERGRCVALAKAFADQPEQILPALESGHDVAKCKAEAFDALKAKLAKSGEAKQAAGATDSGDGVAPVAAATPPANSDPSAISDPKARAEAEWKAMSAEDQKKYHSDQHYIVWRVRDLKSSK